MTTPKAPTRKDALSSGFSDLQSLRAYLEPFNADGRTLYRVEFRYTGPSDDQEPGRIQPDDTLALTKIDKALDLRDRNSGRAWTRETLYLIANHPGESSAYLAAELGVEQQQLKQDMRKLKQLGLTISLETGYRLSDKGDSYLDWLPTISQAVR